MNLFRVRLLIEALGDKNLQRLKQAHRADPDNPEAAVRYGVALKRVGHTDGNHLIVKRELDDIQRATKREARAGHVWSTQFDDSGHRNAARAIRALSVERTHKRKRHELADRLSAKLRSHKIPPHTVVTPDRHNNQSDHLYYLAHAYGFTPHAHPDTSRGFTSFSNSNKSTSPEEHALKVKAHNAKGHAFLAAAKGAHPKLNIELLPIYTQRRSFGHLSSHSVRW